MTWCYIGCFLRETTLTKHVTPHRRRAYESLVSRSPRASDCCPGGSDPRCAVRPLHVAVARIHAMRDPWSRTSRRIKPTSSREESARVEAKNFPIHTLRIARTAVARTKILHVYGFGSIRILLFRGEIPQHTDNSPGNLTRRILACKLLQ